MYRHEAVNFSNENQYLGFGSSYYTHVDTFSKKDDAFNKKKKKERKPISQNFDVLIESIVRHPVLVRPLTFISRYIIRISN